MNFIRSINRYKSIFGIAILAIVINLFIPADAFSQDVDKWLHQFYLLDKSYLETPKPGQESTATDSTGYADGVKFLKMLHELEEEEHYQHKLQGALSIGFKSIDASSNSFEDDTSGANRIADSRIYDANVGVNFKRGNYPNQVRFSSNIGIRIDDKQNFTENLSDLQFSYDRYLTYHLESYVFLHRYSNNFMSIDQRYEVGAGFVLDLHPLAPRDINSYNEVGTIKKGRKKLDLISLDSSYFSDKAGWVDYYLEKLAKLKGKSKEDSTFIKQERNKLKKVLEQIQKKRDQAAKAIKKRHSRLRIALLVGVFNELEKASILVPSQDSTVALPGQQIYRWEVRPTIESWLSDHVYIRADYYVKPAFGSSVKKQLQTLDPSSDLYARASSFREDWDIRQDIRLTIGINSQGAFGGGSGFGIEITFRRLLDSIPPFTESLIARDKYDNIQFKLNVKF